ncbi:MAG: DUF4878 domain-containing protein [Bacteroidaceae bacterium]|nr:DUF4878 domain-containing protein [Bacteroidaceae bacterium]
MKKNIVVGLLGLFLFCACGPGKPGDAFLDYLNDAIEGDINGLAKNYCRDGQALTTSQDSLNQVIMQDYQKYLEEKYQGLKRVEVVRDSLYEEGQKADIRARLIFNDGKEEEVEYEMDLVDGRWMINLLM